MVQVSAQCAGSAGPYLTRGSLFDLGSRRYQDGIPLQRLAALTFVCRIDAHKTITEAELATPLPSCAASADNTFEVGMNGGATSLRGKPEVRYFRA